MNLQDLLVIGLIGVPLAAVGYAFYIRLRAKRFTRERYAFAFLASSTVLFVTVVTSLLAEPPWTAAFNLINQWLSNTPQPIQTHPIERIFVLLGSIILVWLQYRIWRHWSGGRSVRQADADQNREPVVSVLEALEEGIEEIRRLLRHGPAPEVSKETLDHAFDTRCRPWRVNTKAGGPR